MTSDQIRYLLDHRGPIRHKSCASVPLSKGPMRTTKVPARMGWEIGWPSVGLSVFFYLFFWCLQQPLNGSFFVFFRDMDVLVSFVAFVLFKSTWYIYRPKSPYEQFSQFRSPCRNGVKKPWKPFLWTKLMARNCTRRCWQERKQQREHTKVLPVAWLERCTTYPFKGP